MNNTLTDTKGTGFYCMDHGHGWWYYLLWSYYDPSCRWQLSHFKSNALYVVTESECISKNNREPWTDSDFFIPL